MLRIGALVPPRQARFCVSSPQTLLVGSEHFELDVISDVDTDVTGGAEEVWEWVQRELAPWGSMIVAFVGDRGRVHFEAMVNIIAGVPGGGGSSTLRGNDAPPGIAGASDAVFVVSRRQLRLSYCEDSDAAARVVFGSSSAAIWVCPSPDGLEEDEQRLLRSLTALTVAAAPSAANTSSDDSPFNVLDGFVTANARSVPERGLLAAQLRALAVVPVDEDMQAELADVEQERAMLEQHSATLEQALRREQEARAANVKELTAATDAAAHLKKRVEALEQELVTAATRARDAAEADAGAAAAQVRVEVDRSREGVAQARSAEFALVREFQAKEIQWQKVLGDAAREKNTLVRENANVRRVAEQQMRTFRVVAQAVADERAQDEQDVDELVSRTRVTGAAMTSPPRVSPRHLVSPPVDPDSPRLTNPNNSTIRDLVF
jgi:hypothetical protein